MIVALPMITNVADILREASRAEILPRFRNLAAGAIREKTSPIDVVTDADEAAEAFIVPRLAKVFPGAFVLGEEAAEKDPALFASLDAADIGIVLDPVDGTKNFASGLPLFAVMAAVLVKGEIVAGVVLDPVTDDVAIALRGEGAWTQSAAGSRTDLAVCRSKPVAEMVGGISWHFMPEPLRSTVTGNMAAFASAFTYRCAGHEYRLIAAGQCDFLCYHKLMPWDHAPGWLLHREAGGYSACFDGKPYAPSRRAGGLICAPDAATWQAVHQALTQPRRSV